MARDCSRPIGMDLLAGRVVCGLSCVGSFSADSLAMARAYFWYIDGEFYFLALGNGKVRRLWLADPDACYGRCGRGARRMRPFKVTEKCE